MTKRHIPSSVQQSCAASKKRKTDRLVNEMEYVQTFKAALAFLAGQCPICRINGVENDLHAVSHCPYKPLLNSGHDPLGFSNWKFLLKYGTGMHDGICYHCHILQCHDQLDGTFTSASDCEYPNLITPLGYAMFHRTKCREDIEVTFKVKLSTPGRLCEMAQ